MMIMNDDDFPLNIGYMKLAKGVSKFSNHRIKVGAVISGKKPIMACSNKSTSHPLYANGSDLRNSLHAECRAIINSSKNDLNGSTIYVFRETKKGKPALAMPCKFCMDMIKKVGIKKVYFTVESFPYYSWLRV